MNINEHGERVYSIEEANSIKRHKASLEDLQAGKSVPKTLTREQKRLLEKVEIEAQQTFQSLADRYLKAFIESTDPEGEEIKATATLIDTLWRTYVKRRKLDPKASVGIRMYITDVMKDYAQSKKEIL